MAHFQCRQCSNIVVAQSVPQRCASCGAPAREAYPEGNAADRSGDREPVDGMFDVTGSSGSNWNPMAANTVELDEEDIIGEGEGVSSRLVGPSRVAALSRLAQEQRAGERKPLAGRVAYPLPHTEESLPFTAVEVDEMVAAGLPPVPPRPTQELATQTESLQRMKTRRLRRALWIGGLSLVGLALGLGGVWLVRIGLAGHSRAEAPGQRGAHRVADAAPAPSAPVAPAEMALLADAGRRDPALDAAAAKADTATAKPNAAAKPDADRPRRQGAKLGRPSPAVARPAAGGTAAAAGNSAPTLITAQVAKTLYDDGLKLLLGGELPSAVTKLKAALKADPTMALAYRALGLAYTKLKRPQLAVTAFERYLRLRPQAPDRAAIRRRVESLRRPGSLVP